MTFLPPEAEDEIGRLGHYRILKVLGSGGMGIVFLAQDLDLKRLVALKAMHPALAASKSARDRFMREAQAAAALDHDNVVTIHHVGRDRDIPFLAMPLLRGKTLEECLVPGRAFPVEKVVRIGREICQGLAAAHAQGLIHRDIKPGNIWLEEGTDRVKILDFGLARSADSETHLTRPGTIVGTPAFMSPEQARSETVDARSDLFSLGCLLYVMSTGEPAFIGPNNAAILAAVEKENPLPPRKLKPQVPGELSDVIMRLLAKDREQRPESAAAVIESLRQIDEASDQQRAVTSFPVGQIESPVAVAQNDVQSASRNRTGSKWMFDSRVLHSGRRLGTDSDAGHVCRLHRCRPSE